MARHHPLSLVVQPALHLPRHPPAQTIPSRFAVAVLQATALTCLSPGWTSFPAPHWTRQEEARTEQEPERFSGLSCPSPAPALSEAFLLGFAQLLMTPLCWGLLQPPRVPAPVLVAARTLQKRFLTANLSLSHSALSPLLVRGC